MIILDTNVVSELMNPHAKADLQAAFNQLQTYKREIPSLFTYNALLVISDGINARAVSLSAPYSREKDWLLRKKEYTCAK